MTDYEGFFGEEVAARYDEPGGENDPAEVTPAVDLLEQLAAGGPVLEFAIGTGRVAVPLHERGLEVHGIDDSPAMVAKLREKVGDAIPVEIGDMATAHVDGEFALVYLVFNTINNLTTQDAQVACFENAAAHLAPGGCFVMEVGVPALQRLPLGQNIVPFDANPGHFGFDVYDVVTQRFSSQHFSIDRGHIRPNPVPFRYVWPAELDLMARIARMSLMSRWADWQRSTFVATSSKHISVWRRPGAAVDGR
jgi:SAM-dependent methyltransferase